MAGRHILVWGALLLLAGCAEPVRDLTEWVPPDLARVDRVPDGWPELRDAKIRPGAQVLVPLPEGGAGACTSNFLFRSPDNATLYLGIAAHCFGSPSSSASVGTGVTIAGIANAGEVAWNLWETNPSATADFGLIKLHRAPRVRDVVHPAVMHYGGPTALADSSSVLTGQYVISYGHSPQRPDGDPENPREGVVVHHEPRGDITVVTDHPGIQGDSGSGLMMSDGQALGVLSRKLVNPVEAVLEERDSPTTNYYVELDNTLAEAKRELGDLQLVTWELLQTAVVPLGAPSEETTDGPGRAGTRGSFGFAARAW